MVAPLQDPGHVGGGGWGREVEVWVGGGRGRAMPDTHALHTLVISQGVIAAWPDITGGGGGRGGRREEGREEGRRRWEEGGRKGGGGGSEGEGEGGGGSKQQPARQTTTDTIVRPRILPR